MHDSSSGVLPISIFDLDRTLTRNPTYSRFLLRAAAQHQPLRLCFVPTIVIAMALHKAGVLSRKRLKEMMHALMLGRRIDPRRLATLTAGFVARLLTDGLHAGALARLSADRRQNRLCVLATAAPDFYARPIGEQLGFDATISTRCSRNGDALLARIEGENCYGPDKLCAIQAWLSARRLERSAIHVRFYSDDRSDLPTFEWADEPVVVNPRGRLRAIAGARGWAMVDWRSADEPQAP